MTIADDPYAATVPWRVTGLLAGFGETLTAADVHVARRLGAIGGETDERVLLAAALAVEALRGGSVCVVLDDAADAAPDDWHDAVRRSPLVADGPDGPADRPLRWVDGRVYLDRYWRDEQAVRAAMHDRLARPAAADAGAARRGHRPPLPVAVRRRPARGAPHRRDLPPHGAHRRPGHGQDDDRRPPGRRAAGRRRPGPARRARGPDRQGGRAPAGVGQRGGRAAGSSDREAVGPLQATTVHRLLGWRPGTTTRFRHDRLRRLPHDVVIVDESSMVSLSLMARLVEALRPTARLVLVGDPDQLASVEAGAVLGDLVAALPRGVVRLTHAYRYGPALAALAEAIRLGDADSTLALLRSGDEHLLPGRAGRRPPVPAGRRRPAGRHRDQRPRARRRGPRRATPPRHCARSAPTASCSRTARARSASPTGPRRPSRGSAAGAGPVAARPPPPGHRERPRERPLQRRHRRRGLRRARRRRRRVRRSRRTRAWSAPTGCPPSSPCTR